MNLCVDIGNSRVKIGLFSGKTLADQWVWSDWTTDQLIRLGLENGVENLIFSTVAQPDPIMVERLMLHFHTTELSTETGLPFENHYSTPHTLGKDRLAAVAGAHALFPGENCCVIDCGTCVKYDVLTARGIYVGGNIAPGARMRIQAMHRFTARLPEVAMEMPEAFIGTSTETALQNGALLGTSLEIAGFIELFEEKYPALRVILTGGDAAFFYRYLKHANTVEVPDLTLHGLNNILIFNT